MTGRSRGEGVGRNIPLRDFIEELNRQRYERSHMNTSLAQAVETLDPSFVVTLAKLDRDRCGLNGCGQFFAEADRRTCMARR